MWFHIIVDWSEDDGESSDEGATGSEAERASTDDERECLIWRTILNSAETNETLMF